METPNTSTGTRGWIVADRTPQHGCELPPSWLAAPAEFWDLDEVRLASDDTNDTPVCEWCGVSVDDFTTLAFAPYCSAECQECDETETVWALQHGPHTSPDE